MEVGPEQPYADAATALADRGGVTGPGSPGGPQRFGAASLKVNTRIFAMLVKGGWS